ncbi:MAG: peptide chain release factor 1 [Candidatus Omnitrophota bacterium]|jgi:peptide chain release factor 1
MAFEEKSQKALDRFCELETLLGDNDIISDQSKYQKIAKEYSDLTDLVNAYREYLDVQVRFKDAQEMVADNTDPELTDLAKMELEELTPLIEEMGVKIDALANPRVEEKDRNLIFEVRAGTGGEEASLFASDLFRMYTKYCDVKGWTLETINFHESDTGGLKEVVFSISGVGASKLLKFESGVHRVQRVPATEASGRIHTSAATVAVMFEPEEIDMAIDPQDLRIDIFRSSGPGGQSVNTTDSAVRITHVPTGIVVQCQDERSQLKNKDKAMRVLRARLQDRLQEESMAKESADRKLKVGSGDRSEKIRTYNFPDRRVTDHRIGFTTHKLQYVLDGAMDEIMEALQQADAEESLND